MSADTAAGTEAPRAEGHAPRALRTCACGHDRNHHMVSASPQYSFPGWCAILIGVSWPPRSVTFTCRRCDQTLEKTADPDEIKMLRV